MQLLVIGSIFLATTSIIFVVFLLFFKFTSKEQMIKKRMNELKKVELPQAVAVPFVRDDTLSQIPLLNRILEKLNVTKNLAKLIQQADMNIKVGQLVLFMFASASMGLLLSIRTSSLIIRAITCGFLFFVPIFYVKFKRSHRLKAFIREFPDAIAMITSALRAGHAFPRAMQLVAEEAPEPSNIEFRRTYEEYNLGAHLRDAMWHMAERVDSTDLRLFITAVLLQKETGGNLSEILENISYTVRERFKLMGQMRTFTAQGRMSGLILGCLPIAFILLISLISPGYLTPMLHSKLGHVMLGASAFLQIVGFIIINKIVQVKYQ